MKNLLNSVLLFICAIILAIILGPIGIIYTIGKIIHRIFISDENGPIIKTIGYTANTFRGVAKGIDQIGNVVCRDLFNDVLIIKGGHRFGDVRETISSVLGKNERIGTLTKTGNRLVRILNKIEKDHCEKSIIYILKE